MERSITGERISTKNQNHKPHNTMKTPKTYFFYNEDKGKLVESDLLGAKFEPRQFVKFQGWRHTRREALQDAKN